LLMSFLGVITFGVAPLILDVRLIRKWPTGVGQRRGHDRRRG